MALKRVRVWESEAAWASFLPPKQKPNAYRSLSVYFTFPRLFDSSISSLITPITLDMTPHEEL
jgi:hypothetical protein